MHYREQITAERDLCRERTLGRYLRGEISRQEAVEQAGIDWVDLAEQQHAAMTEDLAWANGSHGKVSLSKAAETAGVSVSEMMDVLAEHGIASDLSVEDYRESLHALRGIW
jgi:hypothetical protein